MKAVEMTGSGKHGKRYSRFPPFPLPLEIALRFPHSHRHDQDESFSKKAFNKQEVFKNEL
jgi:hypothetical protein